MKLNPFFRKRAQAYKTTFSGPNAERVLADLKRFCRANVPTANVDNTNTTYLLEGRREVFLRIISHIELTDDEIMKLVEEYEDE